MRGRLARDSALPEKSAGSEAEAMNAPRKSDRHLRLCLASLTWAQDIQPVRPQAPIIVRPYLPVTVPPIRLANSERLGQLVRAGMLYLTAQDAIALVLENNIDIEVSRYNPFISEWQLERAQAGGALPGVPGGASQAGSVASGQGVAGSQAAAGVTAPGASSTGGRSSNATISQIGPVTPEPGSDRARDHHVQPYQLAAARLSAKPGTQLDSGHARVHRQLSTRPAQRRHRHGELQRALLERERAQPTC